jgi:hypothetical protein
MRRLSVSLALRSLPARAGLVLGSRLRDIAAMQHTSIDVYAYVGWRINMPVNAMDCAECVQEEDGAFFALFCSANCSVFRHGRGATER